MMEDSLLIFFYFLQIIIKIVKQNFIFILVEILYVLDFMISTIYINFYYIYLHIYFVFYIQIIFKSALKMENS